MQLLVVPATHRWRPSTPYAASSNVYRRVGLSAALVTGSGSSRGGRQVGFFDALQSRCVAESTLTACAVLLKCTQGLPGCAKPTPAHASKFRASFRDERGGALYALTRPMDHAGIGATGWRPRRRWSVKQNAQGEILGADILGRNISEARRTGINAEQGWGLENLKKARSAAQSSDRLVGKRRPATRSIASEDSNEPARRKGGCSVWSTI